MKPIYKRPFLICFVNRPPQSQISWFANFERELEMAINMNDDMIVMDDLNLNYMMPDKLPQRWVDLINTYHFHQIIKEPTRVTNVNNLGMVH